MASATATTEMKVERPFTTAAMKADLAFWRHYIASRPAPPASFFDIINEYHASHSDGRTAVAHDVGTGPGNIAQRLLPYYDRVVGSDVNAKAFAAASLTASREDLERLTFIHAPAEDLATAQIPSAIGVGNTDLVVVGECMPHLDAPQALQAFHKLLRPNGTLAIYFYGRPIFVNDDADELNAAYEILATRMCRFILPIKDTPGFPFWQRALEGLVSFMDNISLPADAWKSIQRLKWNSHHTLQVIPADAFDFSVVPVDRRGSHEMEERSVVDLDFWTQEWDADRVEGFILSVFPDARKKAGEEAYKEVEKLFADLRKRMCMGGGSSGAGERVGARKVTFPVVLILATRK